MNRKPLNKSGMAFVLVLVLLLAGFSPVRTFPVASAESASPSADFPETMIEVRTVDEFLSAIGSDRVIRLMEGEYNLTQAVSYGQSATGEFWYWEDGYDGFQLRIFGVQNLSILGSNAEVCNIVTAPRYANVLSFADCKNLELQGLCIGHTPEGYCSGGVLDFSSCTDVSIRSCDLYGCGTVGISASNCRRFTVWDSVIHDCTYGAIEAYSCRDFRFLDGRIEHCGISKDPEWQDGWTGFNLIRADDCDLFAVVNSEICGNVIQTLFSSYSTSTYLVLGCKVEENTVGLEERGVDITGVPYSYNYGAVFDVKGEAVCLSGTAFNGNTLHTAYFSEEDSYGMYSVVDLNNSPLEPAAIKGMAYSVFPEDELGAFVPAEEPDVFSEQALTEGGAFTDVHVTTADEFLAAIGNRTVIHVDTDLLDFSTASNYGGYGGSHYYWADNYDGPGLVITGVSGLYIMGQGKDKTTLQAVPRYSDVLFFDSCHDVYVGDLTAGHTKEEPGSCSGDVLEFLNCDQVIIAGCGLFGCGVNGIVAENCSDFLVHDTEIYDCSWMGTQLYSCSYFNFERCSIHDCYSNTVNLWDSRLVLWNGSALFNGENAV